jgi:hypothetical protein
MEAQRGIPALGFGPLDEGSFFGGLGVASSGTPRRQDAWPTAELHGV